MAAKYATGDADRKFEHYEIDWEIQNYFIATFKKDWIFDGPEICVKIPRSKWKMFLTPDYIKDSVCLQLQRLDPGRDTIRVHWRVTLMNKDNKHSEADREYRVGPKSSCSARYHNSIIENILPPLEDTLLIQCQLIVSSKNISGMLKKSFSPDLPRYEGKEHDIVIKTGSMDIKAHKKVLNFHSPTCASLITQKTNSITLNFESNLLLNVMHYLYTNEEKYVFSMPTISLYECIMFLDIKELLMYYLPNRVNFRTTLDVQVYKFLWTIRNVSSRSEDTIMSPILNDGISETCWKLQLKLERVDGYMHMCISAHNVEAVSPMTVLVEFFAMNNKDDVIKYSRKPYLIERKVSRVRFCKEKFFVSELSQISSLLPDNVLNITFKIQMLLNETVSVRQSRSRSFTSTD